MRCPECEKDDDIVTDSRTLQDGIYTRRRRMCKCGYKFTTYEMALSPEEFHFILNGLKKLTSAEISKLIECKNNIEKVTKELIDIVRRI